ncbi:hypothetical protein TNCV_483231 [Trichonephila clavipes]|uniref:Uncharacterized protein n=1 Tax=Trichonephila clavipes TaxID=2585209 RepID=A0A8X6UVM2_TRICX|nr:hypothetical protein TNCV_483231 [Trichonephila clavipes]
MLSLPTLVSPLPPTPVASQSLDRSQDMIYDSLPPMEQSMVPKSPMESLKDLLPVDFKPPVVSKPPEVSTLPEPPVKKLASPVTQRGSFTCQGSCFRHSTRT